MRTTKAFDITEAILLPIFITLSPPPPLGHNIDSCITYTSFKF